MSGMQRIPDPYRELGVPRGATDAQIKAAFRRLAKRFHPDAAHGDTERFLSVQEAYSLLSDPLRRHDWDDRHAPGPVRASDGRARPRARGATERSTTHDGPSVGTTRRGRPAGGGAAGGSRSGAARGGSSAGQRRGTSAGDDGRRDPDPASSGSGRDPATRSTTWSAAGVPWWEDFRPKGAPEASGRGAPAPEHGPDGAPGATPARAPDMDVYNRSSGAAWSQAARRYFRRGEEDLPRGGAFRYRGTQVVTGAEARRVTAEEASRAASSASRASSGAAAEELLRPRPGTRPAPRQSFDHEPPARPESRPSARAAAAPPAPASRTGAAGGAQADRRTPPTTSGGLTGLVHRLLGRR